MTADDGTVAKELLEQLRPGVLVKLASLTRFEQFKAEFAVLRAQYRAFAEKVRPLTAVGFEAKDWSEEKKAFVRDQEHLLDAYELWLDTLSDQHDSQGDANSTLRLLMTSLGAEMAKLGADLATVIYVLMDPDGAGDEPD